VTKELDKWTVKRAKRAYIERRPQGIAEHKSVMHSERYPPFKPMQSGPSLDATERRWAETFDKHMTALRKQPKGSSRNEDPIRYRKSRRHWNTLLCYTPDL
jgi:hypothetical protein